MDALSHCANPDKQHRQPPPSVPRFGARVINFLVESVDVPGQSIPCVTPLQESLDYKIRRTEKPVSSPKLFFFDSKHIFVERTLMTGRQSDAEALALLPHNLIRESCMSVASLQYGWYPKSLRNLEGPQRSSWPRVDNVDLAGHLFDPPGYDVIVQRQRSVGAYEFIRYP